MAQPSLSQFVQGREETLGVYLFQRGKKGVSLTEAGEFYLAALEKLEEEYHNLLLQCSEITDLSTGSFRLGVTSYLGTMLLPRLIPQFQEKYPNMQLDLREQTSSQLEESTQLGLLDMAIMHKPLEPKNIRLEVVVSDPFLLAIPPNSPFHGEEYPVATPEMIEAHPFIMIRPTQRIGQISHQILDQVGVQWSTLYTTSSFETARSLVDVGLGATFLPRSYALAFPTMARPSYKPLPPLWNGSWELCLAYPKNAPNSTVSETIANLVKVYIQEECNFYGENEKQVGGEKR